MTGVVDKDEYGNEVSEEYRRLGAGAERLSDVGLYVRFEPGFGLNVHIGVRRHKAQYESIANGSYVDDEKMVIGILGWERLCELADEWRARRAAAA